MYKWAAAVQRTDSLGIRHCSGVLIAPDLFITAGHVTPRDGSLTARLDNIKFGGNFNTSSDIYDVRATQRFPGYVSGDTSTIDLGVGWTTQFVPNFTPTVFASSAVGQTLTMAGFGNYGDATTGELPSLGDKLAGRAVGRTFTSNYNNPAYMSTLFPGPTSPDPLSIRGMTGDSGSGWWNSTGNLAMLSIAAPANVEAGSTIGLNLSDATIQAYLQPLIQESWTRYNASVPEPGSFALIGAASLLAAGYFARRKRT